MCRHVYTRAHFTTGEGSSLETFRANLASAAGVMESSLSASRIGQPSFKMFAWSSVLRTEIQDR